MADPFTIAAGISALGTLGTGITSGVMAGHGQYKAYKYNKKLQEHQYNLNMKALTQQYSKARQGLESAGYNPILAAGSGISNASQVGTSGVGASSGDMPDIGSSVSNAYRAFKLETQNMKNQTEAVEANANAANAQAEFNREQAITEQSKRNRMDVQNRLDEINTMINKGHLDNETKRTLFEERYGLMNALSNQAQASAAQVNASAAAQNAQTNAKQFSLNKESTVSEQAYRDKHPVYNFVDRWSKAISPWATPAVIGSNMNRGSTSTTSYNVNPVTGQVKNVKKTHTSRRRR